MKEHILIIEDNEDFKQTLVNLLKREGYDASGAKDGLQAIEMTEKDFFELIVIDVKLPGMDGIEVAKRIKEAQLQVKSKIIIITGYADAEVPLKAIKLGVDDYIYKPFKIEEFLYSVERSIKSYQLEREKERNIETIEIINKELVLIYKIVQEISSHLELKEVLDIIVNKISTTLDVEICSILLVDKTSGELSIRVACGLNEEIIEKTSLKPGERISGWVIQHKEAVLVEDIEKDSRFARRSKEKYYTRSFISVPLMVKDETIGVMNINNKRTKETFTEEDLRFFKSLASAVAIAIENASLYTSLENTYLDIVMALTSAIDVKDHYTKDHCKHVTKYGVAIAKELGLPKAQVDKIGQASQLHDIGKIGVHDYILTKPGSLTPEEWGEMKSHPLKGSIILKPLSFLGLVVKLVEQHHERYDGKGYPFAIKGEDIKLGARIMAVADSFDAMTTQRPYRKAMSRQEAVEELKKCSGAQFDPKIVDAFLRVLEKNPQIIEK